MNRMKILLSAVLVFAATASIAQDFSDPRYAPWGDTPEQRKQNILTSNLLKEAVDTRDYDAAAVYFRTLAQEAPSAFEATFIRGAQVYSNKVQRAQDLNEKKALLDSLMMIYDLRVQYFPSSPNYGTAYVLDRKAREYLTFNPSDREGVRKLNQRKILIRLLKSSNSFSPGSPVGVPKGICAIIIQLSGRFQVRRTSSSIKGL